MLDILNKYRIILASNSPRRKELLEGMGLKFEVRVLPNVDESYPDTLYGRELPLYLARKKARAYMSSLSSDELLITADTVVHIGDEIILGKPKSHSEAKHMLRMLSDKTHEVTTGVALTTTAFQRDICETSHVTFAQLSEEEIEYYVSNFRPTDKAGAYGIQEWLGYIGVEKIVGSYFNVMGLPVHRVYRELVSLG